MFRLCCWKTMTLAVTYIAQSGLIGPDGIDSSER